jgi:hypothetical protein
MKKTVEDKVQDCTQNNTVCYLVDDAGIILWTTEEQDEEVSSLIMRSCFEEGLFFSPAAPSGWSVPGRTRARSDVSAHQHQQPLQRFHSVSHFVSMQNIGQNVLYIHFPHLFNITSNKFRISSLK